MNAKEVKRVEGTESIRQALAVIADAASRTDAVWLVGGSAGLMLRGLKLDVPPRDLDLYADSRDAALLHEALRAYAIDEPKVSISTLYRSELSHYLIHGVQVELVGGFVVTAAAGKYVVEVREELQELQLTLACMERRIGIVPLAHELWFNVLRQRNDRIKLIADAVRAEPEAHMSAFRQIEARNAFTTDMVKLVHAWIGQSGTEELQ
ncbi:hypothetical protein [Paenibacillus spongiae]|uniref:Nucleotidyl transferase AbiEii/AbiGii toxin family protein n=1 Tax=Paenibacillus spongiae TaxID=2909671 RepID=A0ABY5SI76_9BACL|nr:hypothetical protein [Paenibacillus spongiae]UVI32380.1 hypothetical protein L1F29_11410 [Paenibacillus spongiae]